MSNGTVTGTNGPSNVEGIAPPLLAEAKKLAGEIKKKSRRSGSRRKMIESSRNVIVFTEWWRSFSLLWAGFGFLFFFIKCCGVGVFWEKRF